VRITKHYWLYKFWLKYDNSDGHIEWRFKCFGPNSLNVYSSEYKFAEKNETNYIVANTIEVNCHKEIMWGTQVWQIVPGPRQEPEPSECGSRSREGFCSENHKKQIHHVGKDMQIALQASLTWLLDGSVWSASPPGQLYLRENVTGTHCIEAGWVPEPVSTRSRRKQTLVPAGNRTT
jgi:hypothetical protein